MRNLHMLCKHLTLYLNGHPTLYMYVTTSCHAVNNETYVEFMCVKILMFTFFSLYKAKSCKATHQVNVQCTLEKNFWAPE